jgi:2-polyprenyl-3-methyl-5-hydroxy-6-metoxy-1,4-benzoquinol methylase
VKIGPRPENPAEWLALQLDLAPTPIADTQVAYTAARAIMAATTLGVFDAIAEGHTNAAAIAAACATDPRATTVLLDALVAIDYLRFRGGTYKNARHVTKWLLANAPCSLRAKLLFQRVEWDLLARLERFVKTGRSADLHANLGKHEQALYQDAMRALAASYAPAIADRLALPSSPARMVDVGGSHGLCSVALCRKHPSLRAEILELPEAIPDAAKILAREHMGARVRHRAGSALRGELGRDLDLVLVVQLVHHFDGRQNAALARRAMRALKPGGVYAIADIERQKTPGAGGALGGTMDLYFALTSAAGTWSVEEMRRWQTAAGLRPRRPIRFPTLPGFVLQTASKQRR